MWCRWTPLVCCRIHIRKPSVMSCSRTGTGRVSHTHHTHTCSYWFFWIHLIKAVKLLFLCFPDYPHTNLYIDRMKSPHFCDTIYDQQDQHALSPWLQGQEFPINSTITSIDRKKSTLLSRHTVFRYWKLHFYNHMLGFTSGHLSG